MTISSSWHRFRRPLLVAVVGFAPLAATAEDASFKDLQLSANGFVLRAKSAEISGSSLSRTTVEAALKNGDPAKLVEQLGKLGATSITFGDFQLERTQGGPPKTLGFGKLVLTGVSGGKIRALQGAEGKWQIGAGQQSQFASLAASELDAAFLLRLLGEQAEPADVSQPLVASAVMERFESRPGGALWLSAQKITLKDMRVTPQGQSRFGALGALEISEMRMPLPAGGAPASKGEVRLRSLIVGADKPTSDDVPTRYRAKLEDLSVPLPESDPSPTIRNLRGLGLEAIVASAGLEGTWQPGKKELTFERLGVAIQNLGTITLSGRLANVAPDVFTQTGTAATEQWGQALVETMSVVLRNTGLYERAVARTAKNSGRSVDDVKAQVTTVSTQTIRQMTAGLTDKTVPDAMIRFFEAPRSLTVSIAPKAGAKLPLSALLARGGMAAMTDKVQIRAVAE
ncbi:MAG: hypothetical protein LCH39_11930 [Proteobacteria bacterium]|nr:hypothetical protein [Pseudomonadota bacterium]